MKWRNFKELEWVPQSAFSTGIDSAISEWRQREKRKEGQKILKDNAKAASAPYVPTRTAELNAVVAVLGGEGFSEGLFFVGRITNVSAQGKKITVQWYDSAKLDGMWNESFLWKPGKGVGPPYTSQIDAASILDHIPSLQGKKKGKLTKQEFDRIVDLANLANKHKK